MKIILGSKNPSKERSLVLALNELGITDFEIFTFDSQSGVANSPIGYEIIRGAENRNSESKDYAISNNIEYDYLCAIEGGFSVDESGHPFVVTYTVIEDKYGKKSTGKSLGIRLSQDMFQLIKYGGSLNSVIDELSSHSDDIINKHGNGITGFLTNGHFTRAKVDKDSVISAFVPFIFKHERDLLSNAIKEKSIISNE